MRKILLIRLDKIGDLVCTLPVDQTLDPARYDVHWAISKGMSFVVDAAVPRRKYIELDKSQARESFAKLREHLRREQFDLAVSFQAPWWVSLALWLESVPERVGVRSQWHSFMFFTRGLRQKRSRAIQHEADYNFDLLRFALHMSKSTATPVLKLETTRPAPDDLGEYAVVHPGMAGSALNWPQINYVELIKNMSQQVKIVITGTKADEPWLADIREGLHGHPNVVWRVDKLSATDLLAVLKHARWVLAPSTGVAHLAAALGTRVVALFSPIRVQHPTRWAPRGPRVEIFVPSREGENCMEEISVPNVAAALKVPS